MEVIIEIPSRVFERITHWADRDAKGCLVSRYSVGSHGYAQVGWNEDGKRRVTTCHTALWRYVNGAIPEGMTVDHRCRNRKCVEITHLRLLTNFDNARRMNGQDWPLGQCINGHPDSELRQLPSGRKYCGPCKKKHQAEYRERKRQRQF